MTENSIPAMITEQELANELGLCRKTITRWREARKGPPHVRIGSRIRYRVEDVKAWIEQNVTAA